MAKVHGDRRGHRILWDEFQGRYAARAELTEREGELGQRRWAGALTTSEYEEERKLIALKIHEWETDVWVAASPYFLHTWFSDDLSREVPDNLY